MTVPMQGELVRITSGTAIVEGLLSLPDEAGGVTLFAHGSGSGRFSPRNNFVAQVLVEAGMGTLLIDLLTTQEDQDYRRRFDISLLTKRLHDAARWLRQEKRTAALPIGLFGASTGAAAALRVAAANDPEIAAVVSRGGRPDLAGREALEKVYAPTLLIVGGLDDTVLELNRSACKTMRCEKELEVVRGAGHLFEEPGKLQVVASLAVRWLTRHMQAGKQQAVAEKKL